jgi:ribosomal protein S17E
MYTYSFTKDDIWTRLFSICTFASLFSENKVAGFTTEYVNKMIAKYS